MVIFRFCSIVKQALYLKTADIQFSLVSIPYGKSLLKVSLNVFDTMFCLICDSVE